MTDDEEWHVYPSGLAVKGNHHPRIVDGVDTLTGEKLGPEDLTPEEAEARSVEHRRQRALSVFADPVWTVDRALSWIGYRDIQAIEVPFKTALYEDSRPTVEGAPRLVLLHALQRGDLRAVRQRGKLVDRIDPVEWFPVEKRWSIDQWPECTFASTEVRVLWPAVPLAIDHDSVPASAAPRGEPKPRGRRKDDSALVAFIASLPAEPQLSRNDVVAKVEAQFGPSAFGRQRVRNAYATAYQNPRRPGDTLRTVVARYNFVDEE